jgi:hypothetical protein
MANADASNTKQPSALLIANIRRSLGALDSGEHQLPGPIEARLQGYDGDAYWLRTEFVLACPFFCREDADFICGQEATFGFYAVRGMLRGFLLALAPLRAAVLLRDERLYGPSVAMSYTAAFHALLSYLAGHGHVRVDRPSFPFRSPDGYAEADKGPEALMAALTAKNRWKFEGRRRSHSSLWGELKQVWSRPGVEIPLCFDRLYGNLVSVPWASTPGLEDIASDLRSASSSELLDRFLGSISEARHTALYEGFGADPHVYEALVNRDIDTGPLELRARVFSEFAASFLLESGRRAQFVLDAVTASPTVRTRLFMATWWPWLDSPLLDSCPEALRRMAERMVAWLGLGEQGETGP